MTIIIRFMDGPMEGDTLAWPDDPLYFEAPTPLIGSAYAADDHSLTMSYVRYALTLPGGWIPCPHQVDRDDLLMRVFGYNRIAKLG